VLRPTPRPAPSPASRVFALAGSLVFALPGSLVFALAGSLRAQPPPPDIEEILVSGERRRDTTRDEPISVTSFDQSELDRYGISDLASLQAFVPSLHVGRFGSVLLVTLRGLGLENITAGGVGSVCLEQDGVPLCRASDTDAVGWLYDLESLDVHRGPQGSAGGRSMTGGKIALTSRPPQPELEVAGDVQYGTRRQVLSRALLNVPIAREKLMSRFSVVHEDRDGYTENLVTGRRKDWSDDARNLALRGQLRSLPSRDLELRLIGGFAAQGGVGYALTPLKRESLVIGDCPDDDARPPRPSICPARNLPPDGQVLFSSDPRRSAVNDVGARDNHQAFVNGVADFSPPALPLLGPTRLSLLAGWRESVFEETRDYDGFNANLSKQYEKANSTQRVLEASLASDTGDPLEWKLGFFYFAERIRIDLFSQQGVTGLQIPFNVVSALTEIRSEELAGYADLRLPLGSGAFALVGVRRTRSERDALEARGTSVSPLLPARPLLRTPRDAVWHAWTPRIGMELDLEPHSILAASLTFGFKTGGFALGLGGNSSGQIFEPEKLWTFELLSKNEWFDDRLALDLGFFWTDYDRYQSCFNQASTFSCYVGEATSYGVELELRAEPFPDLEIDANFDYLHARIDDLFTPDSTRGISDPRFGDFFQLYEGRLPRSPDFSAAAGIQYGIDLGRYGTLTPRVQAAYRSRTYYEVFNYGDYGQPKYVEIDARLGWSDLGDRFLIEGFVDNIGDVDVISNVFIGGIFSDSPVFAAYLPPRTTGVRFGWKF